LSGLFFGLVPGIFAVAMFLVIGVPMLVGAATLAIHVRRHLRERQKARAKAARLAAKNAARRKAPAPRLQQVTRIASPHGRKTRGAPPSPAVAEYEGDFS
jgi:hypothetical protein